MHLGAHNLNCIELEETLFTLQKCYLSKALIDALPKSFPAANHVLVQYGNNLSQTCVCKLYWCVDVDQSFCQIDASVVSTLKLGTVAASGEIIDEVDHNLNLDRIEVLPPVINVDSISITPVFENVQDIAKWNKRKTILVDASKDILRLFTVLDDCIIYLKNLNKCQRFGIHCIIVHGFSTEGCNQTLKVGRITSATTVHIANVMSKIKFEQLQNASDIHSLGGLDGPYETLKEIIISQHKLPTSPQEPSMLDPILQLSQHILLIGPSGCGKTSLVRKVAADCGAALVAILGPEVCRPRPGDTELQLRQTFDQAFQLAEEGVCILLLDEVDSLCPERNDSGGSSHLVRVTSQLLSLLERASTVRKLTVVATTNRPYALDSALRRHGRLAHEIHIGVPTESEREEILKVFLTTLAAPSITDICARVARLTPGYVGADLALICQDVAIRRFRRNKMNNNAIEDLPNVWLSDFRLAVTNIRPSLLRGGLGVVTSKLSNLPSIGGLSDVKKALKAAVEWPLSHPEAFTRLGLPQPRGVLLYGPPGCAKTTIAQAIALANNTTFLSVSAAELYSPFVGDAEKNIAELFHRARLGAPSIVFIDEIDALVGSRGERDRGVQERVLSALLTEMDGIGIRLDDSVDTTRKICEGESTGGMLQVSREQVSNRAVMVIAATNRPDMLDAALLRPGRFDKLVHVPAPDGDDRTDILRRITATIPLASDVDLYAIAEKTHLYSGADLNNLAKEAGLCALTEEGMDVAFVKQKHFISALEHMRPSLTQDQVDWYLTYRNQ